MQVHSLGIEDFCEEEYALIGIHTTLEDYKLAYLLNQYLKISFKKANFNLDFENKNNNASFSIFEYTNLQYDFDWFLISNSIKEDKATISNGLPLFTETKTYLIPEKKNIDFFIKISGDVEPEFVTETIQKIKGVNQIITSYQIDKNSLKSKDFLIF
jgi:hypothetical protein